ncbi:MAG: 5-carboxymethyl-2-hydroxymuconate Delta-isomerase [Rhizobiaceae bacterium]
MPHFQIDYSTNLENRLDMPGLLEAIRIAAIETGLFPLAGIRIRATACTHTLMADGNSDHAFLDLSVRLRAGRDLSARKAATEQIFAAMRTFCAPLLESSSFMLSMEMREIDPELSPRDSSIRKYLPSEK